MEVEFADNDLRRLFIDGRYNGGHTTGIVRAFRHKVKFLMEAPDERTLRNWLSLKYERPQGRGQLERSIHLQGLWSVILERRETGAGVTLVVVGIEQDS
jgi:toxin HigB-1